MRWRAHERSTLKGAGVRRDVDGVLLEHRERNDLKRPLMCRCEYHVRSRAIFVGPQPVDCGHTPAIPGHEAREAKLRPRSAEIVADSTLVLEELGGDHGADCVAAPILGSRPAAPVSIEASERVGAAGLQLAAQHIEITHPGIIAQERRALRPTYTVTRSARGRREPLVSSGEDRVRLGATDCRCCRIGLGGAVRDEQAAAVQVEKDVHEFRVEVAIRTLDDELDPFTVGQHVEQRWLSKS